MKELSEKAIKIAAGEKCKSYNHFGFSIIIPKITFNSETIQIKFSVKNKTGVTSAIIVDLCQIKDKIGHCYQAKSKTFKY